MIRAGPVGIRATYDETYDEPYYNEWEDTSDVEWEDTSDVEWDEKGRTVISHIYVSYDDCIITSIQFGYLVNGDVVLSEKYGPSEGHSLRVVVLNQDEYVTGLSGVLALSGRIQSLTFHTNCGEHGPIGCLNDSYESGAKIEIHPGIRDRREFGGFFGSNNKYNLSSVGIYASPIARSDMVVKRENI